MALRRMEIYGSATHAFSNPDADLFKGKLPIAYDPDAERRSIAALMSLLKQHGHPARVDGWR